MPKMATWTKKNVRIPTLKSYKGTFPKEFWRNFTRREIKDKPESWISGARLREMAEEVGFDNKPEVESVAEILEGGADLGCIGSSRLASVMRNSPTAFQYGPRLVDSLEDWLKDDLAAGPFTKEELVNIFGAVGFKVNPMAVRLKPNGKARIIIDMSSPHHDEDTIDLAGTIPTSVNAGINKDDYPASMASTKDVIEAFVKHGANCVFCKADWTAAYKHIHVRPQDLRLQVVELGGRYFVERALVFGSCSSPGIYDRTAKVIIRLAAKQAGTEEESVLQCLDDVVGFGQPDDSSCLDFYKSYRETCRRVGVILAPEGDKDKAFPPDTEGTILGVEYRSETLEWRIPRQKAAYICATLYKVVDGEKISNEDALRVMGRINHYFPLIQGGKFERHWLMELGDSLQPKYWMLTPSKLAREQARSPDPWGQGGGSL